MKETAVYAVRVHQLQSEGNAMGDKEGKKKCVRTRSTALVQAAKRR